MCSLEAPSKQVLLIYGQRNMILSCYLVLITSNSGKHENNSTTRLYRDAKQKATLTDSVTDIA